MRILFISPYFPYPEDEGGKIRIYNLIKYLSKKIEIHFVSLIHDEKEEKYINKLKQFCPVVKVVLHNPPLRSNNFFKKIYRALFKKPDLITKRYNIELEKIVDELVAENNYDFIHTSQLYAGQYALKHIEKIPFVLSEHNIESEIFIRYIQTSKTSRDLHISKWWIRNYIEIRKLKKYELNIWQKSSSIITVSDRDRKKILKNNVAVIPNGVNIEYFNPNYKISSDFKIFEESKKTFNLVYTGSFTHYPNTDAILYFYHNIFPELKKTIPNIKLYVVGKNPYPDLIKLNEDKKVFVTGYVDDVRPYIFISDIFIVPLRIGGGSRLKILQAMAMKKCVLSTSVGCEGIKCDNNKNIFISDEIDNTIKIINDINQKKIAVENIEEKAYELVKTKYTWKGISNELLKHYQQLKGD